MIDKDIKIDSEYKVTITEDEFDLYKFDSDRKSDYWEGLEYDDDMGFDNDISFNYDP
tara:strand:+ start:727 stop:897 length:171 start_codon:yes stop_codon:yes gene_type:complete